MVRVFFIGQRMVPGSRCWHLGQGMGRGDLAAGSEGLRTMQTLGRQTAWLMRRLRT